MSATCTVLIAEITCTDHAYIDGAQTLVFAETTQFWLLKTYRILVLIIFEVPCNLLWKLIGPGWFLPLTDVLLGMASIGTVFMHVRLKKL